MDFEARLAELNLSIPSPPAPGGLYVPAVRTGNLLYLAGVICVADGQMTHTGKVGETQTVEAGQDAARVCALNALASIHGELGSLNAVQRFVFTSGYVNAVAGFADSPLVINGASQLFLDVFGEAGRHARAAVAVAGLPKDSTVEIQCVVEVA
ncbi:MAG: RidA family protein [Opitutales bacterium]